MPDAPPPWLAGVQALERLTLAAEATALLRAAHRAGLLDAVREPADAASAAASLGLAPTRVTAVLGVLRAWGVVEETAAGWVLTGPWHDLVTGATPMSFDGALGMSAVRAAQFAASLGGGAAYADLDEADRHQVAAGISPDPRSPATVAMAAGALRSLPGADEALAAGGRLLELGCGLASRLCAVLQAYPQARGVGVERAPELAAAARARAVELGVSERVEIVTGDAAAYEPDGAFDVVQWSQFFFQAPSRPGALAVAFRALRSGGWLNAPAISDGAPPPAGSDDDRDLAAMRLQLDLWDVPFRDTGALAAELSAAGFVDVSVDAGSPVLMVRGRRP